MTAAYREGATWQVSAASLWLNGTRGYQLGGYRLVSTE